MGLPLTLRSPGHVQCPRAWLSLSNRYYRLVNAWLYYYSTLFYQASSLCFAQVECPREILKRALPDFCVSVKTPSHNSVWGRQRGRAE